jgi:hypothetical protein
MVPYDVEADPNVAWVAEVWLTDIGLPQYAGACPGVACRSNGDCNGDGNDACELPCARA